MKQPSFKNSAASLDQAWGRFATFLKSRRLKITDQRRALLEFMLHLKEHMDADSIYQQMKNADSGISRGTVYRTLDLLLQCGLVRKNSFGEIHAFYEAIRQDEHHDHLICIECKKVIEFFRPDLEALQDNICKEHHFQAVHHSHQIFGICSKCKIDLGKKEINPKRISHLRA